MRRIALALALTAAACARHHPTPAPAPVPTPSPSPTINSDLGPQESVWHLRSALNVAALLCGEQPGGSELVGRYNALLVTDKAVLAHAYEAERQRYGASDVAQLDRHMTQLYNFFAQPRSVPTFCAAAGEVSQQVATTPADGLAATAPAALARLEDAALAPPPVRVATRQLAAAPSPPRDWRIQLGAFTGRAAAEAAWGRIRAKLPSLVQFPVHYEPVPGSDLIRLQLDSPGDRDGAIRLCASAATGGFDCIAVGHR